MRHPVLAGLAAITLAFGLTSCDDMCGTEMLASQNAPGGKQARLVRTNCGATSSYGYEVMLAIPGDVPAAGTVVLRFDSNHAMDWPQDDAGVVRLTWRNDQQLDVVVTRPVRVFKLRDHAEGVSIHFSMPRGSAL